ncbi:MAG: caspase family protein [Microscillaceae bacterium]|jgi:tetratricopeptide (TPR) repeat protein|nr:caspase family protein [Microscillaceae bacterium]
MKNRVIWFCLILAGISSQLVFAQVHTEAWKTNLEKGVELYNQDKYLEALQSFETAEKLFPTDTFAIVWGAECAIWLEKYDIAEHKLETVINFVKVNDPRWYHNYLIIIKDIRQEYPHALKIIEQMRQKFLRNDSLQNALNFQELSIYLRTKNLDAAQTKLNELLQKTPQNADLNYNMGVLQAEKSNPQSALEYYQKTLEIDPRYFNAYYNIGTYYFNEAVLNLRQISQLNAQKDATNIRQLEVQVLRNFTAAKPYFERAFRLDNTNLDVLQTINTIDLQLENLQKNQYLLALAEEFDRQKTNEVRIAEEKRRIEEARKAQEAQKQKEYEQLIAQERERKNAEILKIAELRQAEEQRIEAEKALRKAKEEADKIEANRRAEELRIAQEKLSAEKQRLAEETQKLTQLKAQAEAETQLAQAETRKAEEVRKQAEAEARTIAETKGNKMLIAIHNLHFEYAKPSDSTLNKGETGYLKFTLDNYGAKDAEDLKISLTQPIKNSDLQYDAEIVVPLIAKSTQKDFKIPIKYAENNALMRGVKDVQGAQNKIRLFVKDPQGIALEVLEFSFHLGKGNAEDSEKDLNTDFREPKNYLLLIGVDKYRHWKPLRNAVKDSKDLKNLLFEKYKFTPEHTLELYDDSVTVKNILHALTKLRTQITNGDNLIIYYSGHGYYSSDIETGYWVPYNAEEKSEEQYLETDKLLKSLKFIDAKHIFLMADACFSGALFLGENKGYIDEVEAKKSRWGLSSGNLELVSDGVGNNSPFARCLLDFLRSNTKPRLLVSEVIQHVKIKVADETDQTPIGSPLKGMSHEGGEFVFHLKK